MFQSLEALGLGLGLGSRDGGGGVGVDEAAALLAVLELGADARAHAGALAVVGAAPLEAVVVGDAAARGELQALAVADVAGARGVGLDLCESGDGDYIWVKVSGSLQLCDCRASVGWNLQARRAVMAMRTILKKL